MNSSESDTLPGAAPAREQVLWEVVARLLGANDGTDPRVQMLAQLTVQVLLAEDDDGND